MKIVILLPLIIVFAAQNGFSQCVRDHLVISSLKGNVVDFQVKEPIRDAIVTVRKGSFGDYKLIAEVRTDAAGKFSIPDLKKGKYELSVSYPNFDRIDTRLTITKRKNRMEYLQILLALPDLSRTDFCEGDATVVAKSE